MNLSNPTKPVAPPLSPQEIWHTESKASLFTKLETTPKGLSKQESQLRLRTHGINQLPQAEPPPWWLIALRQFQSPFVYILAVAGIVSLTIKEFIDNNINA